MLYTTRSSIVSISRVDDDEFIGGSGAGAENGRNVCQRVYQTIQVTHSRSKTSWERFDSFKRLFVS